MKHDNNSQAFSTHTNIVAFVLIHMQLDRMSEYCCDTALMWSFFDIISLDWVSALLLHQATVGTGFFLGWFVSSSRWPTNTGVAHGFSQSWCRRVGVRLQGLGWASTWSRSTWGRSTWSFFRGQPPHPPAPRWGRTHGAHAFANQPLARGDV